LLQRSFPAAPNQSFEFAWDGKDAYGRTLQGVQPATVRIGYVYHGVYFGVDQANGSFAGVGGSPISVDTDRIEITVWQAYATQLGNLDARLQDGVGGWTLNVHNAYDPVGRVLHLGDGRQHSASSLDRVITTVAGGGLSDVDGIPATSAFLVN